MNNCTFIGRLTRDPEIKIFGDDGKIANFTIAVRKFGKIKEGEPDADFFRMTAFGKTAEIVELYCVKGREVGVTARCKNRSYEKDGVTHHVTEFTVNEINLIGSSNKDDNKSQAPSAPTKTQAPQKPPAKRPVPQEDDTDVPF